MAELKKYKIDWLAFSYKVWADGLGDALKEEVVSVTENRWDDATVDILDGIVTKLLAPKRLKDDQVDSTR